MDKCKNSWGQWRCNFEPRYDEGTPPTEALKVEGGSAEGVARILREMRPVTYVCDVCTACGEARNRPEGK